ncbi:hypothetical protein CYMTET_26164 [Cymbomonas tetramitiformis]|uniref:Uncharacterized protein n=1 Tax=Cymbomonas tetramitiformis TaxID=36881 RepID=A0AAE0FSM3_9CHLO|nr:hypothetical protein CYMTET_26164 [Cymbomonas tetramitiformis]
MQSVDRVTTGNSSSSDGQKAYCTPQGPTGHWAAGDPVTPRKQLSERPYFDSDGDSRRQLDFDSQDPYRTPQSPTGHWAAADPFTPRKLRSEHPYFDFAGDARRQLDFDCLRLIAPASWSREDNSTILARSRAAKKCVVHS